MVSLCDRLVQIGIIFLIIFTPIYYGSVTLRAVTVIELTILFMLLVWGVRMVVQGSFVFRRTPLDLVILLFCVYSVISTLFFSEYAHASYMALSLVLCISALYFITVNHIRSRNQLVRLFVVILTVGFVHAFSHLVQNATGLLRASTGVMLNVGNHFAGYMVVIIPLAVAISFVVKDIGKCILLIFASIVMAAAMAFSLIAGAMLAFLFSLALVALLFAGSENTRKGTLILGGVVLCLLLVIFWIGYVPVLNELLTITSLETGSPAGRLSLWRSALAMFADNPITGTGLGTFDNVFPRYRSPDMYGRAVYAHSDWLQLLTELGSVGFMIVLFGLVVFFRFVGPLAYRSTDPRSNGVTNLPKGLVVGGLSSVGAGLAHALVEFNFHIPAITVLFTIVIALTVVASSGCRRGRIPDGAKGGKPRAETGEQEEEREPCALCPLPMLLRISGLVCLLLVVGLSGVLVLRPCIADAYYQDGIELERKLLWEEAIGKYQSALSLSRSNSHYFYALGNVYAKRARLTSRGARMHETWHRLALDAYCRAIELCPIIGDYHLALGNLHEAVGNSKSAESAYAKAVSVDPNNAFYHEIYGISCLQRGEIQKGVVECRKSLDIYEERLYNMLEKWYTINNRIQEAAFREQSFLEIARGICPQDIGSRITLAQFCISKGWHDAAAVEYQKAIAVAPQRIDLWNQLSRLLTRQGKLEEAGALWRRFLISYPQTPQAYAQLAAVHIGQSRLDDAIQQYLTAADFDTRNSGYLIKAADLYIRQGKSAEALKLWQTVIQRNPHEAVAHHRLGRYYESQGEWISAVESFQRAIAADPRNVGYHLSLAQSYYSREFFHEAIQEWEQAVNLQPGNVSIHLQLARVYARISRQDKAREHYWQVLRLQPENIEAQNAISDAEGSI